MLGMEFHRTRQRHRFRIAADCYEAVRLQHVIDALHLLFDDRSFVEI